MEFLYELVMVATDEGVAKKAELALFYYEDVCEDVAKIFNMKSEENKAGAIFACVEVKVK